MDNAFAYDTFTDAWVYILGKQFHWGYFFENSNDLERATNDLTNLMVNFAELKPENHILDIGCGIGEVAFFINAEIGCKIDGITNSIKGYLKAKNQLDENGNQNQIRFFHEDALYNNLPSDFYDVVWLMEMSHLLEDKKNLMKESLRVLKPGGTIVLCDLMFKRKLSAQEIFNQSEVFKKLRESFGHAIIESFDFYKNLFTEFDLDRIQSKEIGENVEPTLKCWKENLIKNQKIIFNYFSEIQYDDFRVNCDSLQNLFKKDLLSYGIIKGIKK